MNNIMMRKALSNVTTDNVTTVLEDFLAPSAAPYSLPPTGRQWGFIQNTQTLVIAILVGVVCFLLTVLIAVMAPYFFGFPSAADQLLLGTGGSSQESRQSAAADPERVKRRYQTITNWLITKDVAEHDTNHCDEYLQLMTTCQPCAEESAASAASPKEQQQQQDVEAPDVTSLQKESQNEDDAPTMVDDNAKTTNSTPCAGYDHDFSDHQNRKDCHICMEEFEVGDKVSWSASDTCNHAYHFQCIKEWLLKKKGCPYCRQTMLPIDDTFTDMAQLVEAKKRKEELTFFCQKDGLVIIPSTSISSPTIQGTDSAALLLVLLDDEAVAESDKEGDLFDIEPPLGNDIIVMTASWEGGSTDGDEDDLETGLGSGSTSTISTSTSLR